MKFEISCNQNHFYQVCSVLSLVIRDFEKSANASPSELFNEMALLMLADSVLKVIKLDAVAVVSFKQFMILVVSLFKSNITGSNFSILSIALDLLLIFWSEYKAKLSLFIRS